MSRRLYDLSLLDEAVNKNVVMISTMQAIITGDSRLFKLSRLDWATGAQKCES